MRRNFTLKVSAFVLGLTLAITEGCIFNDCIYFATYGYRSCGRLNPVESQTSQGPVMIENAEGAPSGCICVTEEEKTLLGSDPSSSELDVVYVKLQAQAQTDCIALAEDLGADTTPCMTATLNKGSVSTKDETSEACWYIYDSSDHEKCPLSEDANDDDAGTSDSSDSDSSESGRPLPDLPGDKLP